MAVNQGENIKAFSDRFGSSELTREHIERDSQLFFHQTLSSPVFNSIDKVDGAYIIDEEGNKYLDLHGNGVHTVGYNNPKVLCAVKEQIESGLTFSPRRYTNRAAIGLAERLVTISPGSLSRVLFCPGGSEAIEMAIMLAKLHTNKWKTLSYYGTFHGAGFQAVSVGADPHFKEGLGPLIPGAIHLGMPDYYRNPWGWSEQKKIDDEYLRQMEEQIKYNPEIAAIISEPVFYNSTVPTRYYWEAVKKICRENNILLIFDEIYTAFGRTGKMFASEHFITPDILVIGKGFGAGILPFAGIIGHEYLNTVSNKSIGHYTHEKNPLCSAISSAMIDFVIEENLVERTEKLGNYFKAALLELKKDFDIIGNVSGLGLNLAVDLVKDPETKERAIDEAHFLMMYSMKKNISFKLIQGNILNLKPSLIITKDEIDYIIDVLHNGMIELKKHYKS